MELVSFERDIINPPSLKQHLEHENKSCNYIGLEIPKFVETKLVNGGSLKTSTVCKIKRSSIKRINSQFRVISTQFFLIQIFWRIVFQASHLAAQRLLLLDEALGPLVDLTGEVGGRIKIQNGNANRRLWVKWNLENLLRRLETRPSASIYGERCFRKGNLPAWRGHNGASHFALLKR